MSDLARPSMSSIPKVAESLPPAQGAVIHFDDMFRTLAKNCLERLMALERWRASYDAANLTKRAFIIEFAGMPKAGKSSAIKTIRHYFQHGAKKATGRSFRIHTPAEGVSLRTPNFIKTNLAHFNTWAGSYALQELLQARHDSYHDLVILDRGPWDAGCWLEYVKAERPADLGSDAGEKVDSDKLIDFFRLPYWSKLSDLHVVLWVNPQSAARREMKDRLIAHEGPASDPKWMQKMREIYEAKYDQLLRAKAAACPDIKELSVLSIDSTLKSPSEVAWLVIERVLSILEIKSAGAKIVPFITFEESRDFVMPYLGERADVAEIGKVIRFLPTFLKSANSNDERRDKIRDHIQKLTFRPREAYPHVDAARAKGDEVVKALEAILSGELAQTEFSFE